MSDQRIDRINKPHREIAHEHITHVGGPNGVGGRWREAVETVVAKIERPQSADCYYVEDGDARAHVSVPKNPFGRKHLQTCPNGIWKNGLLALTDCR